MIALGSPLQSRPLRSTRLRVTCHNLGIVAAAPLPVKYVSGVTVTAHPGSVSGLSAHGVSRLLAIPTSRMTPLRTSKSPLLQTSMRRSAGSSSANSTVPCAGPTPLAGSTCDAWLAPGSKTRNVVPRPGSLSTSIRPPA
jgi:hypothetical protein